MGDLDCKICWDTGRMGRTTRRLETAEAECDQLRAELEKRGNELEDMYARWARQSKELAAAKRHNKDLIDHITGVRPWLGRNVEKLLKGDYAMLPIPPMEDEG